MFQKTRVVFRKNKQNLKSLINSTLSILITPPLQKKKKLSTLPHQEKNGSTIDRSEKKIVSKLSLKRKENRTCYTFARLNWKIKIVLPLRPIPLERNLKIDSYVNYLKDLISLISSSFLTFFPFPSPLPFSFSFSFPFPFYDSSSFV